ncbi:DUF2683 family protein [Mucilaginibacter sp. AW1-3]
METLRVHPNTEEELTAIKSLLKVMKINFEKEEESPYDPKFVDKVKRGEKAMQEGKGVKVDMDNLWK